MIKIVNGHVTMSGNQIQLLSDFTCIIKTLVEHKLIDKEDYDKAFGFATMSDKDLKKEAQEHMLQLMAHLVDTVGVESAGDILSEFFNCEEDDDEK